MPWCAGCKLCTENNWKASKVETWNFVRETDWASACIPEVPSVSILRTSGCIHDLLSARTKNIHATMTTHSIYLHGAVGQGILSHHSPSWHSPLLLLQTPLGRIPFLLLRIRGRKPQYTEEQHLQPTTSCSGASGGFMWIDNVIAAAEHKWGEFRWTFLNVLIHNFSLFCLIWPFKAQ